MATATAMLLTVDEYSKLHEGGTQSEARFGETVGFQSVVVPVSAIFEGL